MIGPKTLAQRLRLGPPRPLALVTFIGNIHAELAFREMVRRLLPAATDRILSGGQRGLDRAAERVWAFCSAFERKYFPIYELDELEPLVYSIPFQRMGWSYDAFHDLDLRVGTLLLRALCSEPYESTVGARVPLLQSLAEHVSIPHDLLVRIPDDGIRPTDLHTALDNTPYAAAAEFADWTWGQTDLAFLDCDDDVEVVDAEWSDENVRELARQWKLASALMDRVAALEAWLEQAPATNFALLLETVLTRLPADANQPGSDDAQDKSPSSSDRRADADLTLPPRAAA